LFYYKGICYDARSHEHKSTFTLYILSESLNVQKHVEE